MSFKKGVFILFFCKLCYDDELTKVMAVMALNSNQQHEELNRNDRLINIFTFLLQGLFSLYTSP